MPFTVILFFSGILLAAQFSFIPNFWLLLLVLSISIIGQWQRNLIRIPTLIIMGCVWLLLHWHFMPNLPSTIENKTIVVEGYIKTVPQIIAGNCKFIFAVLKPFKINLQVNWYACQRDLRVGERWRLWVKCKKAHALMNPSVYDMEKIFLQKKLAANATVVRTINNVCLQSERWHYPIEQLRQKLQQRIYAALKDSKFNGIICALTLGITSGIDHKQWQTFKNTGTNHLVAISGLHVGLVAGLTAKIVGVFWKKIPNALLYVPLIRMQLFAGIFTATCYSLLSGLAASTERALIMIIVVLFANILNRKTTTANALLFALGIIVILDPFMVFSTGFWLSFLAVGLLCYGLNARLAHATLWCRWGKPQWVVTIGMMPTLISLFKQITLTSLIANLIAIPVFSFLIIPCCLFGLICLLVNNHLGIWILQIASFLLNLSWTFLNFCAGFSQFILPYAYHNSWLDLLSHCAAYLTLLPQGLLCRFAIFVWLLPCYFTHPVPLDQKKVQLVVFDVGQGLATLIRTAHHVLIYDTGVKVNDDYDMGKVVLIPYLLKEGIKRVDVLTISHGDNDHIGGAKSILTSINVAKVITSVPERFKPPAVECHDGLAWIWDGVSFTFMSPPRGDLLVGNDKSCVLKVTYGQNSVLLTGDIELAAESYLLHKHAKDLAATILLVPHHGSKTSSSEFFLDAVRPKYAIFSTGYLNSYKHPHKIIIDRYLRRKVRVFNTVSSGAITMTMGPDSAIVQVEQYRTKHRKFWHTDVSPGELRQKNEFTTTLSK